MPEIVRSVLELYKAVAQPIWIRIQSWIRQSQVSDRVVMWGTPCPRSFLRDVVTAWFPLPLKERTLPNFVPTRQKIRFEYLDYYQNDLVSLIISHVINAIGNVTICRSSDQLPVILASGHFAIVPSLARVGHHAFRVLKDNQLFLLEQHNDTEAVEDKLSAWLKGCGEELRDYHRRENIQTPVKSFKFVASNTLCEVYNGDSGKYVNTESIFKFEDAAWSERKLKELGIITLH
ncbi:hypothetical protein ACEPPN_006385 [Leptodophora sp. 'Broadleaf-Isolate-01']